MSTIELPTGDLARVQSIEPDRTWPLLVQIVVAWKRPDGSLAHRHHTILGDEFYGRGQFGAPMPHGSLEMTVERLRREGPPPLLPKKKPKPVARKRVGKGKGR